MNPVNLTGIYRRHQRAVVVATIRSVFTVETHLINLPDKMGGYLLVMPSVTVSTARQHLRIRKTNQRSDQSLKLPRFSIRQRQC